LEQALAPHPILRLHSAAPDRTTYLRRPDLGRRLDAASRERLSGAVKAGPPDIVFVVADGLSARAVMRHAAAVLSACLQRLPEHAQAPIVVVEQARVAVGDEIGDRLGAKLCLVLIGERPGLSVADSLGLYLTWAPQPGVQDSARNCISNIHSDGLSPAQAADQVAWLIREATRRGLTGIDLKAASPDDLLDVRSPPTTSQRCTLWATPRSCRAPWGGSRTSRFRFPSSAFCPAGSIRWPRRPAAPGARLWGSAG
jgi:ethanolamine ammonia-lyase small subunit